MILVHLHDRLRAEAVDEYDRAHREVPPDVTDAILAAGVAEWIIWRDGVELHQLVWCEDWSVLAEAEATTPEHWRGRMSSLVDRGRPSSEPVEVRAAWRWRSQAISNGDY